MDVQPLPTTLRKRKCRANETSEQLENRRARDRENKRLKRSAETAEQREKRLKKNRDRYHKRKENRILRELNNQQDESCSQVIDEGRLPESDRKLLQDFRSKVNAIANYLCTTCNERFPSSTDLIEEMCRRCYFDKDSIKKFSASNNMDPGYVPEELRDLTDIEEMLIAQIFPIVSVYCLRGGQY